jgi:hypothetical protein
MYAEVPAKEEPHHLIHIKRSHNAIVSTVMWPFPECPDRLWHPHILLFNTYQCSFQQIKQQGQAYFQSPPSTAEVKNEWSWTSTPYTCLQGMNGYSITSNFYSYSNILQQFPNSITQNLGSNLTFYVPHHTHRLRVFNSAVVLQNMTFHLKILGCVLRVHVCMCMSVCACVYVHVYLCMCVCAHVFVHVCLCMCVLHGHVYMCVCAQV